MNDALRDQLRAAREGYFERRSLPQVIVTRILIATTSFGLGVPYFLRQSGVMQMGLRYPIAVLVSYAGPPFPTE